MRERVIPAGAGLGPTAILEVTADEAHEMVRKDLGSLGSLPSPGAYINLSGGRRLTNVRGRFEFTPDTRFSARRAVRRSDGAWTSEGVEAYLAANAAMTTVGVEEIDLGDFFSHVAVPGATADEDVLQAALEVSWGAPAKEAQSPDFIRAFWEAHAPADWTDRRAGDDVPRLFVGRPIAVRGSYAGRRGGTVLRHGLYDLPTSLELAAAMANDPSGIRAVGHLARVLRARLGAWEVIGAGQAPVEVAWGLLPPRWSPDGAPGMPAWLAAMDGFWAARGAALHQGQRRALLDDDIDLPNESSVTSASKEEALRRSPLGDAGGGRPGQPTVAYGGAIALATNWLWGWARLAAARRRGLQWRIPAAGGFPAKVMRPDEVPRRARPAAAHHGLGLRARRRARGRVDPGRPVARPASGRRLEGARHGRGAAVLGPSLRRPGVTAAVVGSALPIG